MPVCILPGKWHLLYHKSNKAHHKTAAKYLAILHVRELSIRQQQQHIPISVIQHSLRISCFLLSLVCLELYAFIPSMSIGFICFYIRTKYRELLFAGKPVNSNYWGTTGTDTALRAQPAHHKPRWEPHRLWLSQKSLNEAVPPFPEKTWKKL